MRSAICYLNKVRICPKTSSNIKYEKGCDLILAIDDESMWSI